MKRYDVIIRNHRGKVECIERGLTRTSAKSAFKRALLEPGWTATMRRSTVAVATLRAEESQVAHTFSQEAAAL